MSKKHIAFRFFNGLVVMALLLSTLPVGPANSQAPAPVTQAPPLPGGAFRLTPSDTPPAPEAPAAPAVEAQEVGPANAAPPVAPQSPDTCSAPAKIPFGQDRELLMGPMWNNTTYRVDQTPAWNSTSQVSAMGTMTTSVSGCTSSGPLPEEVYFYKDGNYGGTCAILGPGSYADSSKIGIGNDNLSSLKVGANVQLTVYKDASYGSTSQSFSSGTQQSSLSGTTIGNDQVTSAKVWLVPTAYSVAAIPMGIDAVNVLLKTGSSSGELATQTWLPDGGWGTMTRQGLSSASNPVALARGMDAAYFVRSGANIKFVMSNQGVWGAWDNLPGITDAASDPMVVEPDIYHFKLFYRTSAGKVKFTEWESGIGWRTTPLDLGSPTGTTISSELGGVARDEKHVSVFGVSAANELWVKTWSSDDNRSDWSDTTWLKLESNIKTAKPAAASRSVDQIGVAMLNTSNVIVYKEWTYQAGWKTLTTVGGYVEPVGLAATAGDEMFMYGVNGSGYMYTNKWTTAGWGGWSAGESGWATGQIMAAVVGRPHDLTLVGRNSSNKLISKRYTNQGQAFTTVATANPNYGVLRGQAVATVNGRTAWVSAWRAGEGRWIIAARDTATWSGMYIFLDDPVPNTDTDRVSLTTADLNQDGDDEIVLGTINANNTAFRLSIYKLTHSGTAVTAITRVTHKDITGSSGSLRDIQVAVGDLDGDGVRSEVAVGALWIGYNNAYIRLYRYVNNNLSYMMQQNNWIGASAAEDLEIGIGQVDNQAGEQIVLATGGLGGTTGYLASLKYDPATNTLAQAYTYHLPLSGGAVATGAYATALAIGDVNSDGLDEVVHTDGQFIYAVKLGATSSVIAIKSIGVADANRSLAAGDVDGDGRAEIVYSTDSGLGTTGGWMGILKWVSPENWIWSGSGGVRGVPLLADLDGDSPVATFKRCDDVSDVHVLGVANSQPVWYQNGASVQNSGGGIANSSTASTGEEDGWSTSFGGSVSVGFEHEFQVPLLAIKVGEVRAKVTQEFGGSIGRGSNRESSTTQTEGVGFGSQAFGQGAVCYTQTSYRCYTYEIAKPGSTITTTAQACMPVPVAGKAPQVCSALEDWGSTEFKNTAGSSWAPIGHHPPNTTTVSVNLGWANNYPTLSKPPVDPYRVWWQKKTPINVTGSSNPASVTQNWSVETTVATTTIKTGSFDMNTEVSAGATMMDVTIDASVSVGYGKEWSSSVGWETGLEYNGNVYNYPNSSAATPCSTSICKPYSVVPYVYKAQAKTLAGVTYPYLEQDYYVSSLGMVDQAAAEMAPEAIVGVVPQAPVVTSTTHPDPATWYQTSTVVLNWGQPAGDLAVVTGYKWNLSRSPVVTPTAMSQLTTTQTYQNLADAVYYLHIQAVGDGGDLSPVTHRAVRVDMNSAQVKFVADPFMPNGFNGWYNTPITVSVVANDYAGSGVASVEYSADGTTWLTYTTPIQFTTNTVATLWARATDIAGHTSEPVSTTLKLDQTPPRTVDSDGYGLTYANLITDEVGNAQLVLGGALSDTLSGRLQVEIKAGDTGQWNAVNAVGELPMPPDNEFPTTMTGLNWIYTPTFEIRGVYPLWLRGVDVAGNYGYYYSNTYLMPVGDFWWEPDDTPVLTESQVSVSPHQASPGDEVAFTVAARNSGYQESQLLITNTVPAGLTVVTDSISYDGQYNAGMGVITWTLHALWPGQTQYLFFKAIADNTSTPITLENQVDLMAYWPWENRYHLDDFPAEPARHYYSTTTALTVLPGASTRAVAEGSVYQAVPRILDAAVVEGEIVSDPQVTLVVNAGPEARFLYVKEWTLDATLNTWTLARESDWVPFEAAAGFEVSQDAAGKYGRYRWTLSEGDGVKYLGIWVADADGQVSNVNEGNLVYTNLMSPRGQQLAAGQKVQYRVGMRAGQLAVLSLVSLSGDADLYAWKPRAGFKPNYYSNAAPVEPGLSLDVVAFLAAEEGMYVVEVHAVEDAYYRLVTAGDISGAGLLAETQVNAALARLTDSDIAALKAQDEAMLDVRQTLPQSTHLPLADKDRPDHPINLGTPYGLSGIEQLPATPNVPNVYQFYLTLVRK